jgi:hypothetical protein
MRRHARLLLAVVLCACVAAASTKTASAGDRDLAVSPAVADSVKRHATGRTTDNNSHFGDPSTAESEETAQIWFDAISRGDVAAVEALIARGIDPDLSRQPRNGRVEPEYGITVAIDRGYEELVALLLDAGATPRGLPRAVAMADLGLIELLLEAGADQASLFEDSLPEGERLFPSTEFRQTNVYWYVPILGEWTETQPERQGNRYRFTAQNGPMFLEWYYYTESVTPEESIAEIASDLRIDPGLGEYHSFVGSEFGTRYIVGYMEEDSGMRHQIGVRAASRYVLVVRMPADMSERLERHFVRTMLGHK